MTPAAVLSNWAEMILPVAGVALLAALLPLSMARSFPQSWYRLFWNLLISFLVLLVISVTYFAMFRPPNDIVAITANGEYYMSSAAGLIRLGLLSAMVWGPIVLVVLAMQPQKWRPKI
jgi:glucan phosphoethanolaminetransferase (alkaline phosphatase superfamily)